MGTTITAKGSLAPWNSVKESPVSRGLELWAEFDTDVSRFSFNKADGKAPMVVHGIPQAFPSHARFKGGLNFMQTDVTETPSMTILVLCKTAILPTTVAEGSMIVGGWKGPTVTPGFTGDASANMYVQTAIASVSASASRDNGSGGTTPGGGSVAGTPANQWAWRAMRAASGQPTLIDDLTAGTKNVGSNLATRVTSANKLRVGSSFIPADYLGECDVSCVMVFSEYLTDAELQSLLKVGRIRGQRVGISA